MYILKNVLNTKNTVNKSSILTDFQLGITISNNFLILEKNIASTLPFPHFYNKYNIGIVLFLYLYLLILFLIDQYHF
jgi:hypothetical protein